MKSSQVKRGANQRKTKNVIVIGAEGKNKTEKLYFSSLEREFSDHYHIIFASGNSTDPKGIVEETAKTRKKSCTDKGDMAFAVFDSDTDSVKQQQINEAIALADKEKITTILSVPCFEVWFLQHYRYSTKAFNSNKEVQDELKHYINNYEKSKDVYDIIRPKLSDAMSNSRKLEKHHDELGNKSNSLERNPSTEAYKIVEVVTEKGKI